MKYYTFQVGTFYVTLATAKSVDHVWDRIKKLYPYQQAQIIESWVTER